MKDQTGWPLVINARVRIGYGSIKRHVKNCTRQGCVCKEVPRYTNGMVIKLDEEKNVVDVREFDAMNVHSVRPDMVKVMKGKTRKSFQYEMILDKFRKRR